MIDERLKKLTVTATDPMASLELSGEVQTVSDDTSKGFRRGGATIGKGDGRGTKWPRRTRGERRGGPEQHPPYNITYARDKITSTLKRLRPCTSSQGSSSAFLARILSMSFIRWSHL